MALTGGAVALLTFGLVQLAVVFASDAAPRMVARWEPLQVPVGALLSVGAGTVMVLVAAVGAGTATFGLVLVVAGAIAASLQRRRARSEGRVED